MFPNLTIVAPDAGGAERARAYAKRLGGELAVIDKRRSDDGTAEVMNVVGDVDGRTCIIQDDIIDTAGTIVKAANALKDNGAGRIFACAVHGVLSGPAFERIDKAPIEKLIVTNTIPLNGERAKTRQDRVAVGRQAAEPGDTEHSRGVVGFFAVCVGTRDWGLGIRTATKCRTKQSVVASIAERPKAAKAQVAGVGPHDN